MDFVVYGKDMLVKNGYRITAARLFVLERLQVCGSSLNAYTIAKLSEKSGKRIDVSTVYRILEVFQQLGLVHYVATDSGYIACKHCDHKKDICHHQFICSVCKITLELNFKDNKFLQEIQNRYPDLVFDRHSFEFQGLCGNCNS